MSMEDYSTVPYLQNVLYFLPFDSGDEDNIQDYIREITKLIIINYQNGQYQFAYFGLHLLYMTYIYCTIWKISQIEPERYKDAILFARSYNGREKDLNIEEVNSIFDYSLIPETDIAKLFGIIDLNKSQILNVRSIVSSRNIMAHASGKFDILNETAFDVKSNNVITSIKNIHKSMELSIRKWYSNILLCYCSGKYQDYSEPKDIVKEQMIQNFKLSVNELLICNQMSIKSLVKEYHDEKGYQYRLKKFKSAMKNYCQDMGFIE